MAFSWLLSINIAEAQLARYPFNADVNDQLGNYNPASVFGTPDFSSGEFMLLDSMSRNDLVSKNANNLIRMCALSLLATKLIGHDRKVS